MIIIIMECKNTCDASNNSGNWNLIKIIQQIPEQHTGKALNQGTTENRYTGYSTNISEALCTGI